MGRLRGIKLQAGTRMRDIECANLGDPHSQRHVCPGPGEEVRLGSTPDFSHTQSEAPSKCRMCEACSRLYSGLATASSQRVFSGV